MRLLRKTEIYPLPDKLTQSEEEALDIGIFLKGRLDGAKLALLYTIFDEYMCNCKEVHVICK